MVADTGNEDPSPAEETNGPLGELTPKQERAIIALLNNWPLALASVRARDRATVCDKSVARPGHSPSGLLTQI